MAILAIFAIWEKDVRVGLFVVFLGMMNPCIQIVSVFCSINEPILISENRK